MIKQTILASGLALLATAATAGDLASPTEKRGYQNCLSAAEGKARALTVEKTYFINEQSESRTYYLNGFSIQGGKWAPVRVACETTNSGNRLLTVNLEPGRFAGVASMSVAQN